MDYPMSLENPYTFVDPFQASIKFSVRNLRRQEETTIDDIPLPPLNLLSQQYVSYLPSSVPRRREPSPSYVSYALSRTSSKQSRSPSASSSRNTFGIEVTSGRKDGSHRHSGQRMSSPKLRGSRSSVLLPRSDREVLPDGSASRNSHLHQAASSSTHPDIEHPVSAGSGSDRSRASRRRKNLSIDRKSREEARISREPEIVLEHRHSVARFSTNAISFYKPPTQSSEVALPSSSPYLSGYLPRPIHDPIKNEYPFPSAPHPPIPHHHSASLMTSILAFLLDTLPRQIYLNLMLRLPQLYFTHVIRIFEDAEMSMPEIKKMALGANNYLKDPTISKTLESGFANPRYDNLKRSWSAFIDSLMREWKTMNIISVLLLSAILTILQIPSAAVDPVTRYAALLSLICALMSLLYGCIYIIRFGMMRSTCRAAEWAHEAQKTTTGIFWNVWVFLAMPATWLAWSIFFFIISIMAFVWRTGTIEDASQTPIFSHDALAPRIIVTCLFSLGLVYLIFIRITFQKYGSAMDRAWRTRVHVWMHQNFDNISIDPRHSLHQKSFPSISKHSSTKHAPLMTGNSAHSSQNASRLTPVLAVSEAIVPAERPRGRSTSVKPISTFVKADHHSSASRKSVIKLTKILGLSADDPSADAIPSNEMLISYQMTKDDWERLFSEIHSCWDPDHFSVVQNALQRWNQTFFSERGAQIVLCEEFGVPWLKYAIYHFPWKDKLPTIKDPYDSIPNYLTKLDIYSLPSGADALSLSSSRLDIPCNLQPDRS